MPAGRWSLTLKAFDRSRPGDRTAFAKQRRRRTWILGDLNDWRRRPRREPQHRRRDAARRLSERGVTPVAGDYPRSLHGGQNHQGKKRRQVSFKMAAKIAEWSRRRRS